MNREENYKNIKSEDSREDSALIRDFQTGNRESFEALVKKYKDRIFNLCFRFLGDYQEAEDMSQDVFIKVYRGLNRFRFGSSFYTWLYRIAVNTCKNRIRSSSYKNGLKNTRLEYREESEQAKITDDGSNPALQLEKKEKALQIQQAIDNLHEDHKSMIILRDIEGMSYEDISDITGKRIGTVKSGISRARLELTEKLKGEV